MDTHLLNIANVLYFREWFEQKPITEANPGKSVAYVIGGKEVVIDMPLQNVYELIFNKGQEIRYHKMFTGNKKTDKEEAR